MITYKEKRKEEEIVDNSIAIDYIKKLKVNQIVRFTYLQKVGKFCKWDCIGIIKSIYKDKFVLRDVYINNKIWRNIIVIYAYDIIDSSFIEYKKEVYNNEKK